MLFDRREFLKSLGIVGGSAALGCNTMAPEEKLSAYLTPPAEMVPGVASYYATVCRACPAGCGILVKTREGRPIKLEGNPAHPVNKGKLCARGQASIQGLYSSKRATQPLLRRSGRLGPASWDEALGVVGKQLGAARWVGLLTGLESGSFDGLAGDFTRAYPTAIHVMHEPMTLSSLAEASALVFGEREVPRIDLGRARHVVSLGADFLDTWASPVELSRQWAEGHSASGGRRLQLDYVGPRRNLTAVAADRWFPVGSTRMGQVALTLLHEVHRRKRPTLVGGKSVAVTSLIEQLGPRPKESPLAPEVHRELVDRLVGEQGEGLVLFGGAEVVGADATAVHCAVLLTNVLLGAPGNALRFGEGHAFGRASSEAKVLKLLEKTAGREGGMLVVQGANPAYALPAATGATESLRGKGFTVALAHTLDETTELADAVLPVHHPLESWGDYQLTRNVGGLMQPVRAPLHDTRLAGDVIIDLAERSGHRLSRLTYKDYLVGRWTKLVAPPAPSIPEEIPDGGAPPPPPAPVMTEAEWEGMLVEGGRFLQLSSSRPPQPRSGGRLPAVRGSVAGEGGKWDLVVPFSVELYDGRGAHQDWLREVPDPLTQTAWEIPIEIGLDVAGEAALEDGDRVRLESAAGKIEGRVVVESGLAPGTVALRAGAGRDREPGRSDTGSPMTLLGGGFDPASGELTRAGTRVKLTRLGREELVSVMGSPFSEGRLLALSMGLDELRAGRFPVITRHGEVAAGKGGTPVPMPHQEKGGTRPADNMYSLQEHAKHRWGLVVDLDRCTGCSACAVACYAENNIPVVGKLEVSRGRELSWIRIEKHLFGKGRDERVRFLPVMCQQCDNAPCETVCPVFAASHTTDGLNAQIYNRCIGTRYCSNNCPYKVRRFNYFDYERKKPANQQLNPDVTVRSRGVMEKCTFCIQRIREVQNRRKVEGRPLNDGDIVPACVQTCPTGALSFGDFKQQDWVMSTLARDPRGYRLLDYVTNTRPGVVYLRRVDTLKPGDEEQG